MPYMEEFLAIATIHFLCLIGPGPAMAMTIRNSIVYSRKTGCITGAGLSLGSFTHIVNALVGLGLIVCAYPQILDYVRIAGALYLAYMGVSFLLAKHQEISFEQFEKTGGDAPSVKALLGKGFLTNLLNPQAILLFFSLFTSVVSPNTPFIVKSGYGLWMATAGLCWYMFVATVLSIELIRKSFFKYRVWIDRFTGAFFLYVSVKLIMMSLPASLNLG